MAATLGTELKPAGCVAGIRQGRWLPARQLPEQGQAAGPDPLLDVAALVVA